MMEKSDNGLKMSFNGINKIILVFKYENTSNDDELDRIA
jgi:hypothetical protein